MEGKKVCVVGAGLSGLMTCKYLLEKGLRPVVFEADSCVGGVWVRTLTSTLLQSPKHSFTFSDFPWPVSSSAEPLGSEVLEYIESYARRFDLLRYVRLGERVAAVEYVGVEEEDMKAWELWGGTSTAFGGASRGAWHVTVEKDGSTEVHIMDFLILCLGQYSGLPNIPTFPTNKGPESFSGDVIHYTDLANMGRTAAAHLIKGKNVVVVGFLRSALDVAAECARVNGIKHPCTMVIRTKRWNVRHLKAWGVPLGFLYLNRFSQMLFHKPGEGILQTFLANLLSPLRWIISKIVESYHKRDLPLKKYGMVPNHSFFDAMSSCLLSLLPEGFYDLVERGSIVLKNSKTFEFCKEGIIIEGKLNPIQADLVVFCTGFKSDQKLRDIFVSPSLKAIVAGSSNTIVPLYRTCIHPRIPQLAINGYSNGFTCLHSSEMRAKWIAHFLDGELQLPSVKLMEKDVRKWEEYFKRYTNESFRRSSLGTIHTLYCDEMCKDMGYNPFRKKGFIANFFIPYGPQDYEGVGSKK